MGRSYIINIAKKNFVLGKCLMDQKHYFFKEDFDRAISKFKNDISKGNIFLYIAKDIIPYLSLEYKKAAINDPRIGKITAYDESNNTITVHVDNKYGSSKILEEFYDETGNISMADFGLFGEWENERLLITNIANISFYIKKNILFDSYGFVTDDDLITVKIPFMYKQDENGIYHIKNGLKYSKESIINLFNTNEKLKELIKTKSLPLIIINNTSNIYKGISFDDIVGKVVSIDFDNDEAEIAINSLNFHSQVILMHKDLIGKELFVGYCFIGDPKKSPILDQNGNNIESEFIDIKDIIGLQLIRRKPKEDTTDGK